MFGRENPFINLVQEKKEGFWISFGKKIFLGEKELRFIHTWRHGLVHDKIHTLTFPFKEKGPIQLCTDAIKMHRDKARQLANMQSNFFYHLSFLSQRKPS